MIKKYIKDFCCEDISLIENYKQAVADKTQTWECHHRKETDDGLSRKQLKEMGLYWKRPASELIFLTPAEHKRLHLKGKQSPLKGKKNPKLSAALKGNKKLSAAMKGKTKPKYKWLTPDGEIKIMAANTVSRFHPDWVRITPVGE